MDLRDSLAILESEDSNYNVLGLVYSTGVLAERYEYTPYGKRTVYSRGWLMGDPADDRQECLSHPASTTADGTVMTNEFATSDPASRADLDGDGDVDLNDFTEMAAQGGLSIAAADPTVNHPRHGSFRGRLAAGNPAVLCEFGHQGLQHDEEFDLVYNRARMLVPMQGRFGGRDPLGYVDGTNQFSSYRVEPVNKRDPTGKATGWGQVSCRWGYLCFGVPVTSGVGVSFRCDSDSLSALTIESVFISYGYACCTPGMTMAAFNTCTGRAVGMLMALDPPGSTGSGIVCVTTSFAW